MDDNNAVYKIADELLVPGKGLLAADESTNSIFGRLKSAGVPETNDMQRAYREILFKTEGAEEFLSGVILFDTSMRDTTVDGVPFPDLLAARGIIPGIKVDKGTLPLEGFAGEVITEGLDGLAGRLKEYYDLGARFTKWRAVFTITDTAPSDAAITANAVMLARYATLVQAAGMVPIVEPEVILHGGHSLQRSEEVTMRVLQILFATLREFKVDLKGLILKSSMVLAGDGNKDVTSPEEVADTTLRVFHLSVPHEVPGIVFLSGGQTPKRATENLQAIAKLGPQPWKITFSYSRALEEPVLAAWKGDPANIPEAQKILLHRMKMNSLAAVGKYDSAADSV